MSNVLVVDDVRDYCDELAATLSRDGYDVAVATNAHEALKIGSIFRPDILITDWMLEEHVHGLNISEALRVVKPSVKTILMTGYASGDLRKSAQRMNVSAFLEKPFPLSKIRDAVEKAESLTNVKIEGTLEIGFLEVDGKGDITFANTAAGKMFTQGNLKLPVRHLSDLFGSTYQVKLEGALHSWVSVNPPNADPDVWQIRGREFNHGEFFTYVILPKSSALYLKGSPLVNWLLGCSDNITGKYQIDGHVLGVDDVEPIRQITADIIRQSGGVCHTAATHTEAIHLFAHDINIKHVIIDYSMPEGCPKDLIKRIQALRPKVQIIGSSGEDRRDDFLALGTQHYLQKPWQVEDLLKLLCKKPEIVEPQ